MSGISCPKSYKIIAFLLFITSMGCWIGWGHKRNLLALLGVALVFICISYKHLFLFSKQRIALCITFYFCYLFNSTGINSRVFFTQIPGILCPIMCLICLKDEYKENTLKSITKWFAIILIPSFIIYAITSFVDLPSFGLITPVSDINNSNSTYGYFQNYIFYVKQVVIITGFNRFGGPFTEPGHLGMISAFILMANKFDFKNKYNRIILIPLILSLSLAGYLLSIIGYVLTAYYQGKINLKYTIISTVTFFSLIFIAQEYNNGENVINEQIFSRFESDENRGISGNNRATLYVMNLYQEMWSNSETLLWGYDKSFQENESDNLSHSNGYQFFIVLHGLIGFFLAFVFYLWIMLSAENKKYAILFFIFVFLCFLQRVYWTWIPWILCYEYAIATENLKFVKQKNDKLHIYNTAS